MVNWCHALQHFVFSRGLFPGVPGAVLVVQALVNFRQVPERPDLAASVSGLLAQTRRALEAGYGVLVVAQLAVAIRQAPELRLPVPVGGALHRYLPHLLRPGAQGVRGARYGRSGRFREGSHGADPCPEPLGGRDGRLAFRLPGGRGPQAVSVKKSRRAERKPRPANELTKGAQAKVRRFTVGR